MTASYFFPETLDFFMRWEDSLSENFLLLLEICDLFLMEFVLFLLCLYFISELLFEGKEGLIHCCFDFLYCKFYVILNEFKFLSYLCYKLLVVLEHLFKITCEELCESEVLWQGWHDWKHLQLKGSFSLAVVAISFVLRLLIWMWLKLS